MPHLGLEHVPLPAELLEAPLYFNGGEFPLPFHDVGDLVLGQPRYKVELPLQRLDLPLKMQLFVQVFALFSLEL